jgi:hypothetical protein
MTKLSKFQGWRKFLSKSRNSKLFVFLPTTKKLNKANPEVL